MANQLFKQHEAARERAEAPIEKANKTALSVGDAKVIGAGDDGGGTKSFTAERKSEAAKIIAGIKKGK